MFLPCCVSRIPCVVVAMRNCEYHGTTTPNPVPIFAAYANIRTALGIKHGRLRLSLPCQRGHLLELLSLKHTDITFYCCKLFVTAI